MLEVFQRLTGALFSNLLSFWEIEYNTIMDLNDHDNRNNLKLESSVPLICKTEEVIMGIDEAGRGPVLGWFIFHFVSL